jgi:hypothetical protein
MMVTVLDEMAGRRAIAVVEPLHAWRLLGKSLFSGVIRGTWLDGAIHAMPQVA